MSYQPPEPLSPNHVLDRFSLRSWGLWHSDVILSGLADHLDPGLPSWADLHRLIHLSALLPVTDLR